jgi:hypothetical protein
MKKILCLFFALNITLLNAQTIDDFGRIALRSDVSSVAKISDETKSLLLTKLNQITTKNGMAATDINPRFVITAKIDVTGKDIVPGPPQMISLKLKVTLFVGDAVEQKLFGNAEITVTGTGINETKAYINAINKISAENVEIKTMLEASREKIVAYYAQSCAAILSEAKSLSEQGHYNQAIYSLSLVPDVCSECYQNVLQLQGEIFTRKIETEGNEAFTQAQTLWAQQPDKANAANVMRLLQQINPGVTFIDKVQSFVKEVSAAVEAQELREWEQQVREYNDRVKAAKQQADHNHQLEQMRIKAYRETAIEYAKNQPKTIIYNRLIW